MIKGNHINFDWLPDMNKFYEAQYEADEKVRKAWYLFCYHFLPIVNKDWKLSIQSDKLKQKTFIFKHITSSDEAIVHWFLLLWEPKLREEQMQGWPSKNKSYGEGEHEIKARQQEYVQIYRKIDFFKRQNSGKAALKWNDIFWEEVVKHHAESFVTGRLKKSSTKHAESMIDSIPLPGVDSNDDLNDLFTKARAVAGLFGNEEKEQHTKTSATLVHPPNAILEPIQEEEDENDKDTAIIPI